MQFGNPLSMDLVAALASALAVRTLAVNDVDEAWLCRSASRQPKRKAEDKQRRRMKRGLT